MNDATGRKFDSRSAAACAAALAIAIIAAAGCSATKPTDPYAPVSEATRDTQKAIALNNQALPFMEKKDLASLTKAEDLLRQALAADLYFGPAHNNLGVIYLQEGKYYEAAGEFEWARRLLPGHPDPRVNLAMTLESAGRSDEAIATYRTALEVYPDYIAAAQGLARLQLKSGKTDEKTPALLRVIAMQGDTPDWREWAKGELTRVR
ncbi:MAG: tetratricopeptide repeat protein [Phycisphaeraceae bacterium]|nr:tetratricopeptide repeat protein [Phycisphaeraceae bacterium]